MSYPIKNPISEPIDSINESRLNKIRTRLYAASKAAFTLNYIVSGDSTRSLPFAEATNASRNYYNRLLKKLNVSVYLNAQAGMDANEWVAGSLTTTQAQALAQISGTGANSILEFSFGLNDHTARNGDNALIKADLKAAIQSVITARADIAILLVSPVKATEPVAGRQISLVQIYREIADEMDLPLVDGYEATRDVYGNGLYYDDDTHPGEFGQKRLINRIIDTITPSTLRSLITYDELIAPVLFINPAPIQIGYLYSQTTGALSANAANRSLFPIPCAGATLLTISHQGAAKAVVCMDAAGAFISSEQLATTIAPNRKLYLPYNTAEIRVNIANTGATYDALNDVVSLSFSYMSQSNINRGLSRKEQYEF